MCLGPGALVPLAIAGTVLAAGGTAYGAMSANAEAKYRSNLALENRKHDLAARDDANRRGTIEQMRHYRQVAQRIGLQRAQLAGSGLDVNFGSAADLQDDTLMLGYEDSAIIAENTAREARGYEISAANYMAQSRGARSQGRAALVGGFLNTGSTLLSGASAAGRLKADLGGPR